MWLKNNRLARTFLAPILLRLPSHRRGLRILHLEPVGRAPRPVGRILSLGDDAFEAHLAGVAEYHLAVIVLDVLVEPQAGRGLGQHRGECRLANLQRVPPQVVTVQLDQVEGVAEDVGVVAPGSGCGRSSARRCRRSTPPRRSAGNDRSDRCRGGCRAALGSSPECGPVGLMHCGGVFVVFKQIDPKALGDDRDENENQGPGESAEDCFKYAKLAKQAVSL
jgi:hypothetical protein